MQQPDEVTRYKVCLPDLTNIIFKDMDISKTYYNQGNFFHLAYNKQRTLILSIINCYVKTISKRFNKNKLQLCLEIDSTLGNTPQLNISKDSFFKRLSHQKIENRQFTYEIDLSDPAYTAMYSGQYELSIHASEKSYLITDTLEPTEKRIQNYYYSVSSNNNYSLQIKVTDQKIRKSTSLKLDFIKQIAFPMMQKYLPKQQKVFFESFSTKTYSDNPKAISDFLRQHHPNVKQTWSLDNQKNRLPDKMTKVKLGTFMYYFELATSKVIVTNFNAPHILKTQKQYLIQTMHGVPLKKMGFPIMTDFKSRKLLQDTVRNWDLFTSTSDYLNSIVLESYQYDGDIIPSGYPRNDFLIQNKDNLDLKHNILKSLQIANDKKIILYAPTWRNKSSFDFKFTLSELEKNLGDDYVLIVRAHYFVDKFVDSSIFSTKVINGQHIVDVKELLLISDILITDYSSIMFDFFLL